MVGRDTRHLLAAAEDDARAYVQAPVVAALNRIVIESVVGFCTVAALAAVPLLISARDLHAVMHFALPAAWLAYALVTGAILILGGPAGDHHAWARATEMEPDLARFARAASTAMVVGWATAVAGVLVHHHLASPTDAAWTIGVLVPMAVAVLGLAALAWSAWCRAELTRAQDEAAERLRAYWAHPTAPRSAR